MTGTSFHFPWTALCSPWGRSRGKPLALVALVALAALVAPELSGRNDLVGSEDDEDTQKRD